MNIHGLLVDVISTILDLPINLILNIYRRRLSVIFHKDMHLPSHFVCHKVNSYNIRTTASQRNACSRKCYGLCKQESLDKHKQSTNR
jgi:hypothetical protein